MIFDYRFTYRAEYVRWKGKKRRPVFLTGVKTVDIAEIDPASAPPAYRITSTERGYRETHDVRIFGEKLWWTIFDREEPLSPGRFLDLASTDWDGASRVLDPMRRTYYLDASSVEDFMKPRKVSDGKFWPEREPQEKQAERDAARILFCGEQVLVAAGDPVWYANLDREKQRFDLLIGHSDLDRWYLDRPHGTGFFTPGPDRKVRIACGRQGHVFGYDEVSFAVPTLAGSGYDVRFVSEIVQLSAYQMRASAAAELCVHASAEDLRHVARMRPELGKALPELEKAPEEKPVELEADKALLERFVGIESLPERYRKRITEAQLALNRLAAHEPLSAEDDAVIERLAI